MGLGNPWTLGMWPAACQVLFAKSGGLLELLELLEHSGTFWNFLELLELLELSRTPQIFWNFWNFWNFLELSGTSRVCLFGWPRIDQNLGAQVACV